ncbi:50S ribosomal protein L6 [Candidatus Gottesmanbacteria bacterium]|nr:50S ribosomal protein L6 [Candidatus Gottesmanbacteria bacterium]
MSRIGNAIITVPSEVSVTTEGNHVMVKGPKGTLELSIPSGISVTLAPAGLVVSRSLESKQAKALHGFVRAELANSITGVTLGWTKTLELSGVGYRAALSDTNLVLTVGFSHPITIASPQGITFTMTEGKIVVSGVDKHLVGQVAATIRAMKKPEPYKGKGIAYAGEHIRKKAGKAAKAIGGAPEGAK